MLIRLLVCFMALICCFVDYELSCLYLMDASLESFGIINICIEQSSALHRDKKLRKKDTNDKKIYSKTLLLCCLNLGAGEEEYSMLS